MTARDYFKGMIARLDAENKAAGRCIDCGGSGVVANLHAIERTGDPHINRRCLRCKGDGKYREPKAKQEAAHGRRQD